jgi:hypothetical protein
MPRFARLLIANIAKIANIANIRIAQMRAAQPD